MKVLCFIFVLTTGTMQLYFLIVYYNYEALLFCIIMQCLVCFEILFTNINF